MTRYEDKFPGRLLKRVDFTTTKLLAFSQFNKKHNMYFDLPKFKKAISKLLKEVK